jgi:hypothetical protein
MLAPVFAVPGGVHRADAGEGEGRGVGVLAEPNIHQVGGPAHLHYIQHVVHGQTEPWEQRREF